MARRNWKRIRPTDLRTAMELCVEHAREKHNRSIDTIAELMALNSKWTLYKWMESGNLPIRHVRSFEHACGIDLVSRFLVESQGKLVIDIPRGKRGEASDIQSLQQAYHAAVGELMRFYDELTDVDQTLAAVQQALTETSWHKHNVEKCRQPELPFDES